MDVAVADDGPVPKTKQVAIVAVASVTADKQLVWVNEDVKCTATTDPAGYEAMVVWSGGGVPASSNGTTFTTHWTNAGVYTVTATCGTSSKSINIVVLNIDFVVESDGPARANGGLTDNRQSTVTITIEGVDDPSDLPLDLSFVFTSHPVETGTLINKAGTAISFTPTANPLVWRTSKTYWYGVLPGGCCYSNAFEYEFVLTINNELTVSQDIPMVWPNEGIPKAILTPDVPSTTVIHAAEPVPGIANWYRCLIEFGDITRHVTIYDNPSTDQYSAEKTLEEEYHKKQFLGEVDESLGGEGDCLTAKGIKWWIGWIGSGPWYTYGVTAEEATINAYEKLSIGEPKEYSESRLIIDADTGFAELKAKEYVGWTAAYMYHCTYQSTYGLNPVNHHHPAYQ